MRPKLLTSLDELRTFYPALKEAPDEVLQATIEAVSDSVERFIGYKLARSVESEWYKAHEKPRIYLRRKPVHRICYIDLVQLAESALPPCEGACHPGSRDRSSGGEVTIQQDSPYVLTPASGLVELVPANIKDAASRWYRQRLAISPRHWYCVRYDAGYDPIPAQVRMAVLLLTALRYQSMAAVISLVGARRERIGDYEIERTDTGLARSLGSTHPLGPGGDVAEAMLAPYMKRGINGL